jgi:glycosyltransferase involved in cell wall biosynthesis
MLYLKPNVSEVVMTLPEKEPDTAVQVSIIIPSYNSENTIRNCLDSILAQEFIKECEIIVVDSSADRTSEIVRQNYPEVQCCHLDKKTDPGTARNLGVAQSHGDVLIFIDSDCIARPGWLNGLLTLHRQNCYNVIGGAIENANPGSIISFASYVVEFSDFLPTMQKGPVSHLPTCNISYKRAIFNKFGGFDHRYYPQEDYYFHWQLKKAGQRIYFDPSILVAHHHRTGWYSYLAHQRRIGQVTSHVLKVTDLPGSGFVHRPFFSAIVIPALPFVKLVRTLTRFFKYMPCPLLRRPWVIPVIFTGLIIWTIGFFEGIHEHTDDNVEGISKQTNEEIVSLKNNCSS